MDADYGRNRDRDGAPTKAFEPSLFVWATAEDRAIVDAGPKTLAFDSGPPLVCDEPSATDVGTTFQLGIHASRRLELECAGPCPGDHRARDVVARQQVAGLPGLIGCLGDRLPALVPAAQMQPRSAIFKGQSLEHVSWDNVLQRRAPGNRS
jgi:hypothetical protein